jgi:hypothetical protein
MLSLSAILNPLNNQYSMSPDNKSAFIRNKELRVFQFLAFVQFLLLLLQIDNNGVFVTFARKFVTCFFLSFLSGYRQPAFKC